MDSDREACHTIKIREAENRARHADVDEREDGVVDLATEPSRYVTEGAKLSERSLVQPDRLDERFVHGNRGEIISELFR